MQDMVNDLINLTGSANPFTICYELDIVVLVEPLGSINGFITVNEGVPIILINQDLEEHIRRFTVAHELGHLILEHQYNKFWLTNKTFYNNNIYENEANEFAIRLLMNPYLEDIGYMEYPSYENIARLIDVPYKIFTTVAHRIFK